jgi:hypothetical protein
MKLTKKQTEKMSDLAGIYECEVQDNVRPFNQNSYKYRDFVEGFTAGVQAERDRSKKLVEALEFYSKIKNFEKVIWENDDKTGPCEPFDFDENELVERDSDGALCDFGLKASEALADYNKERSE